MSFRITAILATAALCAFSVIVPAQAAIYTLQPDEANSKDTFLYKGFPDMPIGNSFSTIIGAAKTAAGNHDTGSLIQFDLSSLVADGIAGGAVTSATLKLYSTATAFTFANPSSDFPVTVNIERNTADWGETTATWNNSPATAGIATSTEVNDASGWFEFDVTSLVQGWLNGAFGLKGGFDNYGMRLSQATALTNTVVGLEVGATFVAADGDAAFRPILEITAVPEPSGMFLLATAGLLAMRFRRRR